MATIALYANRINLMPGLIKDVKQSVNDYKADLFSLKSKTLTINQSVCNLDDAINSIQISSQVQEQKIASLEKFSYNSEQFISETARIDSTVADLLKKRKDDFYSKYNYLKPECEKNGWEKFVDGMETVGEWCKEHWKLIVTVVIVVVAVALICTGIGGILGAMAIGALLGAGIGAAAGGIISALSGGSFWEGFENGAFNGAIAGMISGGMGFVFSAGGSVPLSLGHTLRIGCVSGTGTSLVNDIGDKFIKGKEMSWGDIGSNALLSGITGTLFAGIGFGVSKALGSLLKNVSWISEGREFFRIGKTSNSNYGKITSYTTSNPQGVSLNFANNAGKSMFRIEFDVSSYLHYHLPSLFGSKAHIPLSPIINAVFPRVITSYFQ